MPSIKIIRKSTYVASSNGSDGKKKKRNIQKGVSFQQHISLLALIFHEKKFGEKVTKSVVL